MPGPYTARCVSLCTVFGNFTRCCMLMKSNDESMLQRQEEYKRYISIYL